MASGDELRALMRRFPAGVAVITVATEDEQLGLTVASIVSLSLEPPLIGVAVSRQAAIHELLREAGAFSVNLLSSGQAQVAAHFARGVPPIAHWIGVDARVRDGAAPLLEGALGWLDCRLWADYDAGDHTLFAGEVKSVEPGPGERGLVYVNGRYEPA